MTTHNDNVYLAHILAAIEKIEFFVDDYDFDEFITDDMLVDAVIRNFEVIGEASTRLSPKFLENNPDIDFRQAIGFRNRLIHGYEEIDFNFIWYSIKNDLPKMMTQIKLLIRP